MERVLHENKTFSNIDYTGKPFVAEPLTLHTCIHRAAYIKQINLTIFNFIKLL